MGRERFVFWCAMVSLVPVFVNRRASCSSKKQVLKLLSQHAAKALPVAASEVFDYLVEREKIGTTSVGQGVALPHAAVSGLTQAHTLFLRLKLGVDFNAIDDEPVDVLLCYLAPLEISDQQRLFTLAKLNKLMTNKVVLSLLRGAESRAAVLAIFQQNMSHW